MCVKCHDISHDLPLSEESVTERSGLSKHSCICGYKFQFIVRNLNEKRLSVLSLLICHL